MKILVIQLKMIGDVLISSIICNNLRNEYPEAQIDYLVYLFTRQSVTNNPNISNLILFPDEARESKIELFKFIFKIRSERYDIVIDAYSKLESCLITMLSGADRRIGYAGKGLPFSYNEKVVYLEIPETFKGLAIERREKLIEAVVSKPVDPYPKIYLSETELSNAKSEFINHEIDLQNDSLVMVSIIGSEESKTYPVKYMAQIVDEIAQNDVKILFNYIPKQQKKAQEVYNNCLAQTQKKIIFDLIGNDLRSFMAIMSYCEIIVGNDGGAVNVAKALDKPSFTIFSPWIEKISWSIFEDGFKHKAVHLNDYQPEVISPKKRSELQKDFKLYYKKFTPELFLPEFKVFLNRHLKS